LEKAADGTEAGLARRAQYAACLNPPSLRRLKQASAPKTLPVAQRIGNHLAAHGASGDGIVFSLACETVDDRIAVRP
jgi:hypothetical protein